MARSSCAALPRAEIMPPHNPPNFLALPDQEVAFATRYERNSPAKPIPRLCSRQHYGQTLDTQLEQLRAGCTKIYREKVTGAPNDRRELLKMLDALVLGDMVDCDAH